MTSDDLTTEQAAKLREQIAVKARYFNRLVDRLTRLGFDPNDRLFLAAVEARGRVQDVLSAAHYASCKHGVGRPSKE